MADDERQERQREATAHGGTDGLGDHRECAERASGHTEAGPRTAERTGFRSEEEPHEHAVHRPEEAVVEGEEGRRADGAESVRERHERLASRRSRGVGRRPARQDLEDGEAADDAVLEPVEEHEVREAPAEQEHARERDQVDGDERRDGPRVGARRRMSVGRGDHAPILRGAMEETRSARSRPQGTRPWTRGAGRPNMTGPHPTPRGGDAARMRGGAAVTTATRVPRPTVPTWLRALRWAIAGLAAASAVVYGLIGFEVVAVVEPGPDDPSLLWFGIPASLAFLFGAVIMLTSERVLWWALGAIFQVFTIAAYFDVADRRTPAFEVWGIALRIAQMLILAGLVVLIARYPQPPRRVPRPRTGPTAPDTDPSRS
jgi:hypothetical protein